MGFSPTQRLQEKDVLWAIAFSPDTFGSKQKSTTDSKDEIANSEKHEDLVLYHFFATCGGPRLTIYEYETREGRNSKGNKAIQVRHQYTSPNRDEDFYAITFGRRRSRKREAEDQGGLPKQVLCAGGAYAQILIFDVDTCSRQAILKGSIGSILDLKTISCGSGDQEYNLLCSATRDQVRVWNLDTLANICIFAGDPHGHIGDVLSIAWHPTGSRIVSGGGEATDGDAKRSNITNYPRQFQICIWNVLDSPRLQEAIQASSHLPDFADDRSQFNPHIERFAASVHNDVHLSTVDCVAWLGNSDLILSKSIFDEIILWQPAFYDDPSGDRTVSATKSSIFPIKSFQYERNDNFYFVRFALFMDCSSSILAVGNNCGQVYVWNVSDVENDESSQILRTLPASSKKKSRTKSKENSILRGLAFSPDGKVLVGCDANGGVFRWDKT